MWISTGLGLEEERYRKRKITGLLQDGNNFGTAPILSMTLAVLKRRGPRDFFEGFIKVGNMLKSGLLGDELYGFSAVHEHFLCFANSYHLQVFAKVKACQLGEHSAEIGRADVKLLGDLLQRKPFMIIGFDILGNF